MLISLTWRAFGFAMLFAMVTVARPGGAGAGNGDPLVRDAIVAAVKARMGNTASVTVGEMRTEPPLNFFLAKLRDLAALILVGITMVASVLIGGFATQAGAVAAEWLGLSDSVLGRGSLWLVGLAVSLLADTVVFVIVLRWMGRSRQPLRVLLRGALLGAAGFGLLKQLAALILSTTLNNPIYGVFAVMVGLLIWINLSVRVVLYAAAWTETATLGPPPEPTPIPTTGVPGTPR